MLPRHSRASGNLERCRERLGLGARFRGHDERLGGLVRLLLQLDTSPAFGQCVFDLYHSLWNQQNESDN